RETGDATQRRQRFLQELEALAHEVEREEGHARVIATRSREAVDDAGRDRVARKAEDDRQRRAGLAHVTDDGTLRDDEVRFGRDRLAGENLRLLERAHPPSRVDDQVAADAVAGRAQPGEELE